MLKVLLIVVQGKPEGKTIPIVGPVFRVGRGEDCHLRPTSEEVSRRHVEFRVDADSVTVSDLGSRNGTRVNGKLLTGPHTLKSGELVQVGPLTFAVAIQGSTTEPSTPPVSTAPQTTKAAPASTPAAPIPTPTRTAASLDDVPNDQIDAWLVSDNSRPTPDRPSGVYDGETITIPAYRESKASQSSGALAKPKPAPEPEPEPDVASPFDAVIENLEPMEDAAAEEEVSEEPVDDFDRIDSLDPDAEPAATGSGAEEMIDESNPFYAAKKVAPAPEAKPSKPSFESSSDAANDILRRMLDRRRGTPS